MSDDDISSSRYGHIAGWGLTKENGFQSQNMLEAVLPMYPISDCKKIYGSNVDDSTQFCAGYKDGGVDACRGDSGGPLVTVDSNRKPKLSGIISWGRGCARANAPSVYTKVSAYLGWINRAVDTLNGNIPCKDPKV